MSLTVCVQSVTRLTENVGCSFSEQFDFLLFIVGLYQFKILLNFREQMLLKYQYLIIL